MWSIFIVPCLTLEFLNDADLYLVGINLGCTVRAGEREQKEEAKIDDDCPTSLSCQAALVAVV